MHFKNVSDCEKVDDILKRRHGESMKARTLRRLISVVLSVFMLIACIPLNALAEEVVQAPPVTVSSDLPEDAVIKVTEKTETGDDIPNEQPKTETGDDVPNEQPKTETGDDVPNEQPKTETGDDIPNEQPKTETGDDVPNEQPKTETGNDVPNEQPKTETGIENSVENQNDDDQQGENQDEQPATNDEVIKISVTVDGVTSEYEPNTEVNLGTPTKENYIFIGWNIKVGGGTLNGNIFTVPESGEVVIESMWKGVEVSLVIYYVDEKGKTLAATDEYDLLYGDNVEVSSLDGNYNLPSVVGYSPIKATRRGTSNKVDFNGSNDTASFVNFVEGFNPIVKNEVFNVIYAPNEFSYTVKYFLENLDGSYSEDTSKQVNDNGIFGHTILASSYNGEVFDGFTYDHASADSVVITEGTNTLELYYTRNSYNLFYQVNESASRALSKKYGEGVTLSELGTPTRVGYNFKEWRISSETGELFDASNFSMPSHDVFLVATWTPGQATYTVNYWIESLESAQAWTDAHHADGVDAAPTSWTFVDSVSGRTGTVESIITSSMVTGSTPSGLDTKNYLYNSMDENVAIRPDGTTVVNVYYSAKVYSYHFHKNDGSDYAFTSGGKNHSRGMLYNKWATSNVNYWPYKDGNTTIVWKRNRTSIFNATTSFQYNYGDCLEMYYYTGSQVSIVYAIKQNVDGTYPSDYQAAAYQYVTFNGFSSCNITMNASRLPTGFRYDKILGENGTWLDFNTNDNANKGKVFGDGETLGYVYIKLARLEYTLSFNDGNQIVQNYPGIRFEDKLSTKQVPSIVAPSAFEDYEFIGFKAEYNGAIYNGTTPEEAFRAFYTSVGDKMPANNVVLTAVWKAPIYNVKFYTDDTLVDEYASESNIPKGNKVSQNIAEPTRDGYNFAGWWYLEDGVEKPYFLSMPITKDMVIYAKWVPLANVVTITVNHVLKNQDGSETTYSTETKNGVVGSSVALSAIEIDGYWPEILATNYTVKATGNEYTFYYTPATSVQYTVKYLRAGTDEEVAATDVLMSEPGTISIVAHAKIVYGATPDFSSKTLKLTSNPENNVLIFYYEFSNEDKISYTVEYYFENADSTYTRDDSLTTVVNDVTQWQKINREDIDFGHFDEYVLNDTLTTSLPTYANPKGTVIRIYYDRVTCKVTYRYTTEVPTGAENAELPAEASYKWGTTVTVAGVPIAPKGYTFVGWTMVNSDVTVANGNFEMPREDVILEGAFVQEDYWIEVEWTYVDGVYCGGEYKWDCDKLEYVYSSGARWKTEPSVSVTVTNYGSKSVNLNFSDNGHAWDNYLTAGIQSKTDVLDGNGSSKTLTFAGSDFAWNFDVLNATALDAALNIAEGFKVEQNTFKLSVTAA